jgi:hypothetical protein
MTFNYTNVSGTAKTYDRLFEVRRTAIEILQKARLDLEEAQRKLREAEIDFKLVFFRFIAFRTFVRFVPPFKLIKKEENK